MKSSVLGVGFGFVASFAINAYFRAYYRTDLVFSVVSPATLLTAVALAVPLGVLAAALAARRMLGQADLVRGAR